MLIEHRGKRPSIDESAFVAPTAVICGDVKIGPRTCVGFGAVIVSHGCPVVIGTQSIIRENAIVRATAKQGVREQKAQLEKAVASNRRSVELSRELYVAGLSDFLSVLEAQKALYASENQLAQSEAAVAINLVAVYKALGGGW